MFLEKCKQRGFDIKITEGFRTAAKQEKLYAQGRTDKTKPIVTYATSKTSLHCQSKAFDIAFNGKVAYPNDDKKWKEIADIGVECGLTPGFYFKKFRDAVHFQV